MTDPVTVGEAGEQALLARLRRRLPPAQAFVRLGVGDDAAIVVPERNHLDVLTTDATVEGVHVDLAVVAPADVGHRALAVNLSDIAAMGATPRAALLSMGLPASLPVAAFDAVLDGVLALAAAHRVDLVGGNLTHTGGPLWIDVTVLGAVHPRRALCRDGARPGDALFVSGAIGAAAAGLAWLRRCVAPGRSGSVPPGVDEAVERYRRPVPQVRLGLLVGRSRAASACIDLSDGLADAVRQLASASGVHARIDADALPLHGAARALWGEAVLDHALRSDDYELLFAVPRRTRRAFHEAARRAGVPVTEIGRVDAGRGVSLCRAGDELPWPGGYEHFSP